MKRSLAATVLLTFALGVRTTNLLAIMDGQTNAARVPMKEIGGEEVIQVSMNSTGLYDFILDTGSNVTIMRSELVRKLHLSSGAPMGVVTATGETSGQRLSIESIAVAGLATVSGSQKSSCCNPDGQDSTCDSRSLHFLTSS